jgi:hypothetical protein
MHQPVEIYGDLADGTRVRPYPEFERERYGAFGFGPNHAWANHTVYEFPDGGYEVADERGFVHFACIPMPPEIQERMPLLDKTFMDRDPINVAFRTVERVGGWFARVGRAVVGR